MHHRHLHPLALQEGAAGSSKFLGRIPKPHQHGNLPSYSVKCHLIPEAFHRRRELHSPTPCWPCKAFSNHGEVVASSHDPGGHEPPQEVMSIVSGAVRDEGSFVELSLRGKLSPEQPWRLLTVRPVLLRGKKQLQVGEVQDAGSRGL